MSDFKVPDRAVEELANDPEAQSRLLRDEAMDRVWNAADPEVQADMQRAVRVVASKMNEFTADDVWDEATIRPEEPKVLGPVMRWAARQKLCENTKRSVESRQPLNHMRPVAIWRSLVVARPDYRESGLIGKGYAGFVCSDCHCEVDDKVRGHHEPDCPNIVHNESLYVGAEHFARSDTYEAGKKATA